MQGNAGAQAAAEELLGGGGGVRRSHALCRRALVYGNGGIFSSSAVAILGRGNYNADA